MEEDQNKIFINKKMDWGILKLILKRNWYGCLLLFALFFFTAFLYLRYTKPIYESNVLIQINEEDQGADILDLQEMKKDNPLAKTIELLRSQLLFRKALQNLPLEVNYFAKGEVLTQHRYKSGSFFQVQLLFLKDSSLYNIPIYLHHQKEELSISFSLLHKKYEYAIDTIHVLKTPFFNIRLQVKDWVNFLKDASVNQLYFELSTMRSVAQNLEPGLTIKPVNRFARTIEISYKGNNAYLAHDIVTSLAYTYFDYDKASAKRSAEKILQFIDTQLDSLRKALVASKGDIMVFQREKQMANPEHLNASIASKIDQLKEAERKEVEKLRILKNIKDKLQENPGSMDVYRLIPDLIGKFYGSLTFQIKELYQLIQRKENLLYKMTQENDVIKKLKKQIEVKKNNIGGIIQAFIGGTKDKLQIIREGIAKAESQYIGLPQKQMKLSRLTNVKELNEKYFTLLTEKKVMYSITNAGYASNNKILNPATIAKVSIFPHQGIIYGIALFLALVFSSLFLLLRYLTYNQINQLSDLKSIIPNHLGVLGEIPIRKKKMINSEVVVQQNPNSAISEYFRIIRTNLSFINREANTISVTSTISGEGKTFVALNLAGIIAMTGKKVIIVDLDMRKPKVHIGLNGNNQKGVSNILAGHCEVKEAIQKSKEEGLYFIAAGPTPPNPSELLLSKKNDQMIEELKKEFDLIIFDNPPLGLVADGIQLLSKVEIPIYVFRANYSKRNFVNKLEEISKMKGIKNINVVLNAVNVKKSDYGYGSNGYYSTND